jgi:hypothetical protein
MVCVSGCARVCVVDGLGGGGVEATLLRSHLLRQHVWEHEVDVDHGRLRCLWNEANRPTGVDDTVVLEHLNNSHESVVPVHER